MLSSFATMKYTFDYHPEDVYFCTADCGWITGHSYVTYGPMLNAATQVLFEGVPTYPEVDRFWKVCEKYKARLSEVCVWAVSCPSSESALQWTSLVRCPSSTRHQQQSDP